MDEQRINILADKWFKRAINEEEIQELESWYNTDYDNLEQEIKSDLNQDALGARIFNQISMLADDLKTPYQHQRTLWRKISAAAAVLIIFGAGLYFYNIKNKTAADNILVQANEIHPGSNKAYLTLSNGQKIDLTDVKAGNVSKFNGITVSKNKDGQLIYTVSDDNRIAGNTGNNMNTLSTPAGGQYQVILPDGTHVWINSSSSLTYPEHFSDKQRRVTLRGEAYFEVAKDKTHPFVVKTAKQEIEVLGTHFNIHAYEDEQNTITTLAEGSVQVNSGSKHTIIKPGEQAITNLSEENILVKQANLKTQLAWKNGLIAFEDATLPEIMRQVSRWYNIKVSFVGPVKDDVFTGGISRNSNLSSLLEILRANHIHFTIKENGNIKTLIVTQ